MAKFNPPSNFNFPNPSEWPEWKQRFTRYRIATKLHKDDEDIQFNSLIYAMGREAEHIFKSIRFDEAGDEAKYAKVMEKLDQYFVPKRNIIHERARFRERKQFQSETAEAFIRNLYEMSEHCDFTDKADQIRDQIVIGLKDKTVSEKLQLESKLTLEQAIQTARQAEMVKTQIHDQAVQFKNIDAVHKSYGKPKQKQFSGKRHLHSNNQFKQCTRCNRKHGKDAKCPAIGQQCRSCHKMDHFEVCCRSKKKVPEVVYQAQDNYDYHSTEQCETGLCASGGSDNFFLGSINLVNKGGEPWWVTLEVCKHPVKFKIDTGADITVIGRTTYNAMKPQPRLSPVNSLLVSPGGKLECRGKFAANVKYKNHEYKLDVYVVEGSQTSNLLARGEAQSMNMIKRVDETSIFGTHGLVKCKPMKITLRDDAKPYCLTAARRVPFPLLPKVEEELRRMEHAGIIEKVTEPTNWCSPMVPVVKKNGKIRVCVDLKKLNEAVKREHVMLPNLDDISPKLVGAKYFTKLDASSGFHQLPLHKDSSKLTTFITLIGRFCFKRVPFGITSAPEIFQREMTVILQGLEGMEVIIDDILIYGKTEREHDARLEKTISRIRESGLKLNKEKCEFKKPQIEYFGHIISEKGLSPNPERVRAIRDLAAPTNVTELRRVVGMINYLGRFLSELSSDMKPMTDLLKSDIAWQWGTPQQQSFDRIKDRLTNTPVLAFYDVTKPIVVSADASSYGLGGAIFQQDGDQLKPIAYCSRTLTQAEIRYAQIEKECLAGVWACEKFSRYLVGLDSFKLFTDHKPLVPLINSQDLDRTPLRCQRLLLRLRRFNAVAEHVPGKQMIVSDTLSRSPFKVTDVDEQLEAEIAAFVDSVVASKPISDAKLERIRRETEVDVQLLAVISLTKKGWPDYDNSVPEKVKEYFGSRSELSTTNGLLLFRDRIVFPSVMRTAVLDTIHDGHMGISKCRERAATSVWWPGITNDITKKVSECEFCQTHKPTQKREPLKTTVLPERPWQRISADLFELSNNRYLVVMDYYSRYLEVAHLTNITSEQVIGKMKNIFARWGVPDVLVTDNGTQFTSQSFESFAHDYNFKQTFSSPHYPQSNGEAESAVKIAKLILKQDDIFRALMAYRSTPVSATGVSPAELIMGRRMRTALPVMGKTLKPKWPNFRKVRERDRKTKERYRTCYDKHYSARPLPPLREGEKVRVKIDSVKTWKEPGIVKEIDRDRRSCIVETPRGIFRRNRRHLQKTAETDSSKGEVANENKQEIRVETPKVVVRQDVTNESPTLEPKPIIGNTVKPMMTRSGREIVKPLRFQDFE